MFLCVTAVVHKANQSIAAPENVLIYHAGTGRIVFLGMLRTATIFVAGVSSMIIAPAFFADEFPSWLAPLSMATF